VSSDLAVRRITGTLDTSRSRVMAAMPSSLGIIMSSSTRWMSSLARMAKASVPS